VFWSQYILVKENSQYIVLWNSLWCCACASVTATATRAAGIRAGGDLARHYRQLGRPAMCPSHRAACADEINSKQWSLLAQLTLMATGAINHDSRHCCHLPGWTRPGPGDRPSIARLMPRQPRATSVNNETNRGDRKHYRKSANFCTVTVHPPRQCTVAHTRLYHRFPQLQFAVCPTYIWNAPYNSWHT